MGVSAYQQLARRPVREKVIQWLIARTMGIHLGDGTGIASIRKGDGTEFAEVRKGDGTVLFSAADKVVDDFEDGDISEYGGSTGSFSVQTSTVKEGTYALNGDADTSIITISSTTGLEYYPSQGDTFRFWCWVRNNGDDLAGVEWATQSETNDPDCYRAEFHDRRNNWRLVKRSGGTNTTLDTTNFTWSQGWYEGECSWELDGTMTLTLYDDSGTQQAQVSATDTTFSSGGVGFMVWDVSTSTNTNYFFDYYRITG